MRYQDERGISLSLMITLLVPVFILMIGVGVDLVGHVQAEQQAANLARQAARVGGEKVVYNDGIVGSAIDPTFGEAAVKTYLKNSDCAIEDIDITYRKVKISLRSSYKTKFLSLIGINTLKIHVNAEASVIPVLHGVKK